MREVTIISKDGGIGIGRIDNRGRLIYCSGCWIPSRNPEVLDRMLRKNVAKIIEDNGEKYKELIKTIV